MCLCTRSSKNSYFLDLMAELLLNGLEDFHKKLVAALRILLFLKLRILLFLKLGSWQSLLHLKLCLLESLEVRPQLLWGCSELWFYSQEEFKRCFSSRFYFVWSRIILERCPFPNRQYFQSFLNWFCFSSGVSWIRTRSKGLQTQLIEGCLLALGWKS